MADGPTLSELLGMGHDPVNADMRFQSFKPYPGMWKQYLGPEGEDFIRKAQLALMGMRGPLPHNAEVVPIPSRTLMDQVGVANRPFDTTHLREPSAANANRPEPAAPIRAYDPAFARGLRNVEGVEPLEPVDLHPITQKYLEALMGKEPPMGPLGIDRGITGGTDPNSVYTVPNSAEALLRDYRSHIMGAPGSNVIPFGVRRPANDLGLFPKKD